MRLLPRLFLVAAVYVAASWLVYGWTLDAPFLLDDQQTIQNNPAIQSLALPDALNPPPTPMGFSRRPIANLSMALNFAAGDLQISGYRVFNLLLHALNAFLLFCLVRLVAEHFLRLPFRGAEIGAFFAGFFWVLHPLSTSAVHYLTQRPELLAAAAFLSMFYAQARSLFSVHPRRWLLAAWVMCLLAMGSKESMALLPVLSVLFDRCAKRWTWREQWRNRGIYYLLLGATLAWPVMLLIKDDSGLALSPGLEERWRYFLTVSEGVVRHAALVFWPRGMVFDYGTQLVGGLRDAWFPLAVVVVAFGCILWGLLRRSLAAWVGAAIIAVLLPSWLNMAPGQPVAEHRFYLAGGLLLALICIGAALLAARSPRFRIASLVGATIIGIFFAVMAVHRASMYTNPSMLMSSDVRTWPRGDRNYLNLGLVNEMEENYEEAARNYALAANPWEKANWRPILALARTELRSGKKQRATFLASDALRRVLSKEGVPDLKQFSTTLIASSRAAGQLGMSLPLLQTAASSGYEKEFLRNLILQVSAEVGDMAQAEEQFREGGSRSPTMRMNYAIALARSGRTDDAVAELDRMIAEAPEHSDPKRLADVLALKGALLGQTRAAAQTLDTALQADPSHSEALNNLAWLLATSDDDALHDSSRAVELARKACRLQPSQTNYRGTLAVALAANGEIDQAEAALAEAQRLGRVNGNANSQLADFVRAAAERHARNR